MNAARRPVFVVASDDRAALPPYSDTGAGTLGCRLGPQTWTVVGSHYQNRIGYPWEPNHFETHSQSTSQLCAG